MIVSGVTYRCNFNCLFCLDYLKKKLSDPDLGSLRRGFKNMKSLGHDSVMFMTGESLIRPDILKILDLARDCGLRVKVTTNGSRLSDYAFLDKIIACGVEQINISVHSHIPRVANTLSQNQNCHILQSRALENIDQFILSGKSSGLEVCVNTVVNKFNYRHLSSFCLYLRKKLAHTVFEHKLKLMLCKGIAPSLYKSMMLPLRVIRPYLLKSIKAVIKPGGQDSLHFSGFPLCVLSGYEWLSTELQELLLHNTRYFLGEEVVDTREAQRREYGYYKECRLCSLYRICCGVSKSYRLVYPNFNLEVSNADRERIIRKVKSLH